MATVAARIRRFDPIFAGFADGLRDFTPFVPLEGIIRLVDDWARDGLLLIGDAAHTMSPAGAIGVNVAIATALVAAQEIYPRLGHGPIAHADLRRIQQQREADVRALHRLQLAAQTLLLGQDQRSPIVQWLLPKLLPIVLHTPIMPSIQRRIFFARAAAADRSGLRVRALRGNLMTTARARGTSRDREIAWRAAPVRRVDIRDRL